MNWNDRCREAIRKEKMEIEKRYEIRIGQTDIICRRCGKPFWPGRHVCGDMRFEKLRKAKLEKEEETKKNESGGEVDFGSRPYEEFRLEERGIG